MVASERVEKAVANRISMLRLSNPELSTEWAIINDDWGLIAVSMGSELKGYEFIESDTSWYRPNRPRVYADTLKHGLTALIIVPEEVYLDVRMKIYADKGRDKPKVLSYDSMGITLMPRPS